MHLLEIAFTIHTPSVEVLAAHGVLQHSLQVEHITVLQEDLFLQMVGLVGETMQTRTTIMLPAYVTLLLPLVLKRTTLVMPLLAQELAVAQHVIRST